MTKSLAHGCSSDSTQRELSNGYKHDSVSRVFKNLCILALWTKVALALEGLAAGSFAFLEHILAASKV